MWPMVSKFNGRCKKCGGRIRQGDNIMWSRGTGAQHPECATEQLDPAADEGVVCSFCGEPAENGDVHESGPNVWCSECWIGKEEDK